MIADMQAPRFYEMDVDSLSVKIYPDRVNNFLAPESILVRTSQLLQQRFWAVEAKTSAGHAMINIKPPDQPMSPYLMIGRYQEPDFINKLQDQEDTEIANALDALTYYNSPTEVRTAYTVVSEADNQPAEIEWKALVKRLREDQSVEFNTAIITWRGLVLARDLRSNASMFGIERLIPTDTDREGVPVGIALRNISMHSIEVDGEKLIAKE